MENTAIFVSKRLQKVVAAGVCLILAQMLISMSSCTPERVPMPMAARVAITAN